MRDDKPALAGSRIMNVRRYIWVLGAVLLGVGLSLKGFFTVRELEKSRADAELDLMASHRTAAIKKLVDVNVLFLESIRSFYDGSREVERGEFDQFVRPFLASEHDIQALAWVPRVPSTKLAEWEATARREGIENYRVTQRSPTGGIVPASSRDLYYPVFFLEPYRGNEAALGFDLASDAVAREMLDRSRDTGQPTASQRIALVQNQRSQFSFLISVPVYQKKTPIDTVENRRKNLQGFVVGSFRIFDFLTSAMSQGSPLGIDTTFYDDSAPAGDRLLLFHPSLARKGHSDPIADREAAQRLGIENLSSLQVGGRIWSVLCTPAPEFFAMQGAQRDWYVLAAGLALTAMLVGLLLANLRRAAAQQSAEMAYWVKSDALAKMGREIAERKRTENELRKLSVAVEQSPAAIVVTDRNGAIEYVNPKFTQISGYTLAEVKGQNSRILKSGDTPPEEYKLLWETITAGHEWHGEFHNRKKDGNLYWEQAVIAPVINANGEMTNFIAVKKDVTERKKTEAQLAFDELRLESLLRISQHKAASTKELLDFALEEAIRLTDSQIGYLFQYDDERELLTLTSWSKEAMRQCELMDKPAVFELDKTGLWGEPIRQRKPIIVNDYQAPHPQKKGCPAGHVDVKSFLTIPMFMRGRIVATVGVGNKKSDYDQSDVRQLTLLMNSAWNIVERKRADEERENTAKEIRDLYEKAPCGYHSLDADGVFQRINDTELSWLGYSRDEIVGKKRFTDLVTPDGVKFFQTNYPVFRDRGWVKDMEFDMIRKDGTILPVLLNSTAVKDASGEFVMSRTTIFDITDRKRAERARMESEERIRLLLNSTAEAIYGIDLEGRCSFCNPACLHLLGYGDADELLGTNMHWLIHHSRADGTPFPVDQCRIFQAFQKGEGTHCDDEVLWRADGTSFPAEYWSYPQRSGGQVVGAVVTFVDITERKQTENALSEVRAYLEEANSDLQKASEVKSAFLATMSHEIRTPLNAIVGMTSLLLDTDLNLEQRDCSETIRNSSEILLTVINDILDFSKIEAERMELENQPFDLTRCVEEAMDLVAPKVVEKGIEMACASEENLPRVFVGDVARLRQILVNLLSNAVKFTEKGEIVVSVSGQQRDRDQYELHFAVRDTGIGIPADRQDRLFQSFSQVDASTSRRFGGTGLGLAISRRLSEMMGGHIWAESSGIPGDGATFHFTILVSKAAEQSLPGERDAADTAKLAGVRILVIDDNKTSRDILTAQSRRWGMLPTVVASGPESLQLIERGEHFDLAVLDMQMPEMDGIALAKRLRGLPACKDMPLVLLSSVSHRMSNAESDLFAARLTKPAKTALLGATLCAVMGKTGVTPEEQPQDRTSSEHDRAQRDRLRVLLAEDNPINQKVAVKMLGKIGYRADVVANGREALDALRQIPYDVILMDCQMPEMDGYEATRQIRMREQEENRPPVHIIAMTAHAMQGDREQCLAAGMDDYLSKPVRANELEQALLRCHAARVPEDQATATPT